MLRHHSNHYYLNLKHLSEQQMNQHIDTVHSKITNDKYISNQDCELYYDIIEYQSSQLELRKQKLQSRLELISA